MSLQHGDLQHTMTDVEQFCCDLWIVEQVAFDPHTIKRNWRRFRGGPTVTLRRAWRRKERGMHWSGVTVLISVMSEDIKPLPSYFCVCSYREPWTTSFICSLGRFPKPIKCYIRRRPEDRKFDSNRAACYQKLLEFQLALKAFVLLVYVYRCRTTIKLDPTFGVCM